MKPNVVFIAIGLFFFSATVCKGQPGKFTEKKLVIGCKQTVNIKELDMSITNNGCGRQWLLSHGKPGRLELYYDLVVKMKDSTYLFTDTLYIRNLKLVIDKMNPWDKEEDGVPPGGCRVWVRKLWGR